MKTRRLISMVLFLISAVLFSAALGPAPASATELYLRGIKWELGVSVRASAVRYQPLQAWTQKPGDKLPGRVRFQITVENGSKEEVDGVVVRFALSAKIAPAAGGEAVWAIPFELGERRIPKLKSSEIRAVPVEPVHLENYLKRLRSQGFWPEAFKVQVMVDPKAGDNMASNVVEYTVPVKR